MIYIYYSYLSEENHEDLLKKYLPKFSPDYQEKIARYRRWQDAQLSLLGRILLFNGVEEIYNQLPNEKELKYTKYNKPYFDDNTIKFNISHSGDIAVCVFSDNYDVGIDIELITDLQIDSFKSQMTENEWNDIMSNSKKETFFDYWTQKEAVVKALGNGLMIPLRSFEIFKNTTIIKEDRYLLKEIKINEMYKCYIALKEETDRIYLKEKKYTLDN